MVQFVKFDMPEEVEGKLSSILTKALKSGGKVRAGVNEVTKMIERGTAKFVIMAKDVSPEELLMHIPVLCDEKKIPYAYMKDRETLGKASGLKIKASCVAVVEEGQAKKEFAEFTKTLNELKK